MLTTRYADVIRGVISCFDRLLLQGTLPDICHAQAMTRELTKRHIRIFDFAEFAKPLREGIREHAERLATEHGLTIEFIRHIKAFRKEQWPRKFVDRRAG